MNPLGPDFAQVLSTCLQLTFWTVALGFMLGHLSGSVFRDLVEFGLSKWPAYRAWRRKMRRAEAIEWAAYLAAKREARP